VVEDTIELRRYAMRVAQVDLELRLDPHLPLTWADPFQLQQEAKDLVAVLRVQPLAAPIVLESEDAVAARRD